MFKNKRIMKIVLLIGLFLFLSSCSSIFEPEREFTPYDLVGTWVDKHDPDNLFIIRDDGVITFINNGSTTDVPIANWNRIKYLERNSHQFILTVPLLGDVTFFFISDSECEVFYGNNGGTSYYEKL